MGEMNDPVDYPLAMGNMLDALANYLYDEYDSTGGDPWESAGKRRREYWFSQADKMVRHFAKLYTEAVG